MASSLTSSAPALGITSVSLRPQMSIPAAPLQKLPLEALSEIFRWALGAKVYPLVLTEVCLLWNRVVCGDQEMWRNIDLNMPPHAAKRFIELAKNRLRVSLSWSGLGFSTVEHEDNFIKVFKFIVKKAHLVESFVFRSEDGVVNFKSLYRRCMLPALVKKKPNFSQLSVFDVNVKLPPIDRGVDLGAFFVHGTSLLMDMSVRGCSVTPPKINAPGIQKLTVFCPRSLDLKENDLRDLFRAIAPTIERLDFSLAADPPAATTEVLWFARLVHLRLMSKHVVHYLKTFRLDVPHADVTLVDQTRTEILPNAQALAAWISEHHIHLGTPDSAQFSLKLTVSSREAARVVFKQQDIRGQVTFGHLCSMYGLVCLASALERKIAKRVTAVKIQTAVVDHPAAPQWEAYRWYELDYFLAGIQKLEVSSDAAIGLLESYKGAEGAPLFGRLCHLAVRARYLASEPERARKIQTIQDELPSYLLATQVYHPKLCKLELFDALKVNADYFHRLKAAIILPGARRALQIGLNGTAVWFPEQVIEA
jgi:hypothetical protein